MDTYSAPLSMHHRMPDVLHNYPPAEATHQQVLEDSSRFKVTLDRLLTILGIKLKIPKVGGLEVDLHQLYKEVTQLGGLENVINRKQWVTVCEPFNFPASFTNKSFVIKKLYINALHHYEQVYFRRNTGPIVPPPNSSAEPSVVLGSNLYDRNKRKALSHDGGMINSYYGVQHGPTTGFMGGGMRSGQLPDLQARYLPPGTRFCGTVESSFEHGYHLTLELTNGQRISGFMYKKPHSVPSTTSQPDKESMVINGSAHHAADLGGTGAGAFEHISNKMQTGGGQGQQGQQQQAGGHGQQHGGGMGAVGGFAADSSKRVKVEAPRPTVQPRSALFFFASSINPDEVRALIPNVDLTQATVKVAADKWNCMSMEQRQPYLDKANADRMRFETEKARTSCSSPHPHAGPAQENRALHSDECLEDEKSKVMAAVGISGQPPRYPAPVATLGGPFRNNVPALPPSHPMAAALNAAHAKAVAAAKAAGAPPPPPPHMLGIPLAPYAPHHVAFQEDKRPYPPGGEQAGYFSQPYYSSESDMYNQQYVCHAEANSIGPSQAEAHDDAHDDMLCEAATHDYEDVALLQQILGTGDGQHPMLQEGGDRHHHHHHHLHHRVSADFDGMADACAGHPEDEGDEVFVDMLQGPSFAAGGANNNQTITSGMMNLAPSTSNREVIGLCRKVMHGSNGGDNGHVNPGDAFGYSIACSKALGGPHGMLPPSSSAISEENYPAFRSEMMDDEGYAEAMFAASNGDGDGFMCPAVQE